MTMIIMTVVCILAFFGKCFSDTAHGRFGMVRMHYCRHDCRRFGTGNNDIQTAH